MLTGVPPFESDDPLELIHWHIAKPPTAPTLLKPDVPEIIAQIVMKLLAKTPEERYQSASAMRGRLASCSPISGDSRLRIAASFEASLSGRTIGGLVMVPF